MSEYPSKLVSEVSPIPSSVDQSMLNDKGLYVVMGLDLSLAEQLVERSGEPEVMRWCPNDQLSRFSNLEAVEIWQKKGRLSLPLVSKLGNGALKLEGFGWMGPGVPTPAEPQIPGAKTTYAQRIYSDSSGKGNGLPYAEAILDTHATLFDDQGVWLEAWLENIPAIKTYDRAGFKHFATIMGVLHNEPKQREFMTREVVDLATPLAEAAESFLSSLEPQRV